MIEISVVIPTCNRKESLLRTLNSLSHSTYPVNEIIVIDSSDTPADLQDVQVRWPVRFYQSERSVCVQRNIGVCNAVCDWIFLCDDDIEVPPHYLETLVVYAMENVFVGAISGLVLQLEDGEWRADYPIEKFSGVLMNYLFGLGMWGKVTSRSWMAESIKRKGNHVSCAGWPVVTQFDNDHFVTPVYGLGASLVRKKWLMESPYDECLDPNGIGDNYGVAMGFPGDGIHVVRRAFVLHHRSVENRLDGKLTYYRRLLALGYFIQQRKCKAHVTTFHFLWSLLGSVVLMLKRADLDRAHAAAKTIVLTLTGKNPYLLAARQHRKIINPML